MRVWPRGFWLLARRVRGHPIWTEHTNVRCPRPFRVVRLARTTANSPGSNPASSFLLVLHSPEQRPRVHRESTSPLHARSLPPSIHSAHVPSGSLSFETQSISYLLASQPTLERTRAYPDSLAAPARPRHSRTHGAASPTSNTRRPRALRPVLVETSLPVSIAGAPQLFSRARSHSLPSAEIPRPIILPKETRSTRSAGGM